MFSFQGPIAAFEVLEVFMVVEMLAMRVEKFWWRV
jgi:hypothetical protein